MPNCCRERPARGRPSIAVAEPPSRARGLASAGEGDVAAGLAKGLAGALWIGLALLVGTQAACLEEDESLFDSTRPSGPVRGDQPAVLPAEFDWNLIWMHPVTADGVELHFFADTGGDTWIYSDAALEVLASAAGDGAEDSPEADDPDGETDAAGELIRPGSDADGATAERRRARTGKRDAASPTSEADLPRNLRLPEFREDASIPPPRGSNGRLPVRAASERSGHQRGWSGLLGGAWFANRVWTIDYANQEVLLRRANQIDLGEDMEHSVPLHFRVDDGGDKTDHLPRIEIEIGGAARSMLLATGASVILSDDALDALADHGPARRGGSFLAASAFDALRAAHPDWRLLEGADTAAGGQPMIEVPQIAVAGLEVGPVWFARRPDGDLEQLASRLDAPVDGVLGGSALKYFRVTLSYIDDLAVFSLP